MPVQVASESIIGLDYTVMVCPWDAANECICECPGYMNHGHCKHQIIAHKSLCRWDSIDGTIYEPVGKEARYVAPDAQSPVQKKKKICPACGGPTKYELEVVEEE